MTQSITMLCYYSEFRILFTILLNVVMLSVVMMNVVKLSVVMMNVVKLSVVAPLTQVLCVLASSANHTILYLVMKQEANLIKHFPHFPSPGASSSGGI